MAKRLVLSLCVLLLLAAETVFFGSQCLAGLLRLRGERAFFRSDHRSAWRLYHRALSLGGDRETLETDVIELLVFGLDQVDAGAKVQMPLPRVESIRAARRLVARALSRTPYHAYLWSLASDVYQHQARLARLGTPLDLATLSENPLENLLPEERLAISALEKASALEPTNSIYQDLLAELYLDIGSTEQAARFVRGSVGVYPVLSDHQYLTRGDLTSDILEAALAGFEDALGRPSMVPRAAIERDAGRLLAAQGQQRRALSFFEQSVKDDSSFSDARFELALTSFQLGDYSTALRHFRASADMLPGSPWPNYYAGLSLLALGQREGALPELVMAREKGAPDTRFFHKLGEALESGGQVKEAERQFVAAANLNPDNPAAWSSLLDFYVRQHDVRAISDTCSKILSMRPAVAHLYGEACTSLNETP